MILLCTKSDEICPIFPPNKSRNCICHVRKVRMNVKSKLSTLLRKCSRNNRNMPDLSALRAFGHLVSLVSGYPWKTFGHVVSFLYFIVMLPTRIGTFNPRTYKGRGKGLYPTPIRNCKFLKRRFTLRG